MSKSRSSGVGCYAQGGPVLGRTREFIKTPDITTDGRMPPKPSKLPRQQYGKGKDASSAPKMRNKQV